MVFPLRAVSTSPGRWAPPPGMFSVKGTTAKTLTGRSSSAIACMAPSTAAPPDMSVFISSIALAGLIESPPESNTTPLPTRARKARASCGSCHISTTRAGLWLPAATAATPPKPSAAIWASS